LFPQSAGGNLQTPIAEFLQNFYLLWKTQCRHPTAQFRAAHSCSSRNFLLKPFHLACKACYPIAPSACILLMASRVAFTDPLSASARRLPRCWTLNEIGRRSPLPPPGVRGY